MKVEILLGRIFCQRMRKMKEGKGRREDGRYGTPIGTDPPVGGQAYTDER